MRFRDVWRTAKVVLTEQVTPTIRMFEIDPGDNYQMWTPGAHLRVRVNVDSREETRTYSLIKLHEHDGIYRIAVKLMTDGQGGSRYMWSLGANDRIEISQPQNHFELSRHAGSYTLLAGGVGITPFVSMAFALRNSPKPVRLFCGIRDRSEAAFETALREWLGERLTLRVAQEHGPLDLDSILDGITPNGELYVCGPIGLLEDVAERWRRSGRPKGLLRYETFASSGHYATQPFRIHLPRFEMTIDVPAHQSMLAALESHGIELLSDCKRGECGLCSIDVVQADAPVDHRDVFFSKDEKAQGRKICACVSRVAGGTITVDTAYRGTIRAQQTNNQETA